MGASGFWTFYSAGQNVGDGLLTMELPAQVSIDSSKKLLFFSPPNFLVMLKFLKFYVSHPGVKLFWVTDL